MSGKSDQSVYKELTRRGFLTSVAGAVMTLAAPGANAVVPVTTRSGADRELSFYNTHTDEKLSATFWSKGNYLDDGLKEINWLLRDHRTEEINPIDTALLDLLHHLQSKLDRQGDYHVISGYRSPQTNKMLRNTTSGVAKRSYHMLGQAIDVRLPGFDTKQLKKAAIAMKAGGVGYYASSDFVHLDVGRVRYW